MQPWLAGQPQQCLFVAHHSIDSMASLSKTEGMHSSACRVSMLHMYVRWQTLHVLMCDITEMHCMQPALSDWAQCYDVHARLYARTADMTRMFLHAKKRK